MIISSLKKKFCICHNIWQRVIKGIAILWNRNYFSFRQLHLCFVWILAPHLCSLVCFCIEMIWKHRCLADYLENEEGLLHNDLSSNLHVFFFLFCQRQDKKKTCLWMIVIFDHFCNSFQYYITHNLLDDFLANGNSMPNCNFLVLETLFSKLKIHIMIADGVNLKHQRVSFSSSFKYCWQNMTWPLG